MSGSILKRGIGVLCEEGAVAFTRKSIGFGLDQLLAPVLSVRNIEGLSVGKVEVEAPETITVTYGGDSPLAIPALLSRMQGEIAAPRRFVLEFRNAKLFTEPSVVEVGSKFFYPNSVGNSRSTFSPSNHSILDLTSPKKSEDDSLKSAFLIGGERCGFAQWLYEQLPKLYWYEKYCNQLHTDPELIVIGDLSPWQQQSLKLVGYSEKQYLNYSNSQVIGIEKLLVPPHPLRTRGGEFQVCPSAMQWIRDTTCCNVSSSSNRYPNRIYVSRADATRRQVTNEEEVISALEKYGFESVEPGRLSFSEQVRLFSNAELIVGPHGAGLTNMLFANNAEIIELMTDYSGEHFFVLANECDHTYQCLLCEPVSTNDVKKRHSDIRVYLSDLDKLLYSLVSA